MKGSNFVVKYYYSYIYRDVFIVGYTCIGDFYPNFITVRLAKGFSFFRMCIICP